VTLAESLGVPASQSVQRAAGEAGAGKAADRFQNEVPAACTSGGDPLFGTVEVCEEAEVRPQLIAEGVQARWRDREYADAVFVEVRRVAGGMPEIGRASCRERVSCCV
jgi:hypothetical protein